MNKTAMCLVGLIAGISFLAVQQEWLIINWPAKPTEQSTTRMEKRSARLYFWIQERWKHEAIDVLWSEDKAQTAKYLVDAWLTWLEEECALPEKLSLQAALVSPTGQELLLSFDRSPFSEEWSTYEKWHWVESLLKTIRDNGLKFQQVRLLVHHQPLEDYHLDFGRAWPLIGFK